jgi:hypothetical protein
MAYSQRPVLWQKSCGSVSKTPTVKDKHPQEPQRRLRPGRIWARRGASHPGVSRVTQRNWECHGGLRGQKLDGSRLSTSRLALARSALHPVAKPCGGDRPAEARNGSF